MNYRILFVLTFFFAITTSCLPLAAPQDAAKDELGLKNRVLSEYPAALERLRERFSHMHGSGVETIERKSKGTKVSTTTNIKFWVEGDSQKTESTHDPAASNGAVAYVRTLAVNPEYSFHAEIPKKGGQVVLRGFQPRKDSDITESLHNFCKDYLDAPFVASAPIHDILFGTFSDRSKINRVSLLEAAGKKLLKIEYSRIVDVNNKPMTMQCWVIVSPGEGWALQEFEAKAGKGFLRSNIKYESSKDEFPKPKCVEISTSSLHRTFEYQSLDFAPSSPADFTLEGVGLPEISLHPKPPARNFTPIYWAIAGSAACLAVALAIMRTRRLPS